MTSIAQGTEPQARELRDYQREAVEAVQRDWARGTLRVGVVLPTGSGKSTIIGKLTSDAYHEGKRVVLLAHRAELIHQMLRDLRAVDPAIPDDDMGVVMAEQDDHHAPIVGATLQTLAHARRRHALGKRDLILWDECFVAGTLVDGRPIETLVPGDYVTAVSASGEVNARRVVDVMCSRPNSLVQVTLHDGQTFVCTPGHPFLTDEGWLPAYLLRRDVRLRHATADSLLHSVRPASGHVEEAPPGQVQGNGPGVLLTRVREDVPAKGVFGDDGRYEPPSCLGADATAQSDAPPRDKGQGVGRAQGIGLAAGGPVRERVRTDSPAASPGDGTGLADGGAGWHVRQGTAESVLPGHRRADVEGGRGSGRPEPQHGTQPRVGSTTRRKAYGSRVASVAFLEPGRDGRYGGLCPDGLVYNIEVDTDHTYTVGTGVVVHNCHHAGAEGFHTTFRELGGYDDASMCGFTATMRRTERGRIGLGDVIQKISYERDIKWAIKSGHLVAPRGLTVAIDELNTLNDIRTVAGDFAGNELAQVMEAATGYVVEAVTRYAAERRPIVFAASVTAAHAIADRLTETGYPAVAVTGEQPYPQRLGNYEAYRSGETRALVTVMVLTEGADFPMCDAAVLARPTRSPNLYIQMIGRALRLHPGKTDALVLDLSGSTRHMRLMSLSQILPGVESRVIGSDGAELLLPTETDEEAEVLRPPRVKRQGPVRMVTIDLLTGAESEVLWLQTPKGVPFISLTDGWLVFLWPEGGRRGATRWAVGNINTRTRDGGWMGGEEVYLPLDRAIEFAERSVPMGGFAMPRREASWRRGNTAPSEAQTRLARRLRIPGYDMMTKARLSDELSIFFAARVLDPNISANETDGEASA